MDLKEKLEEQLRSADPEALKRALAALGQGTVSSGKDK
jgi:hypothetical protein